eukprot:CAMPEP_0174272846 /NCGR_PEP_ID=MMETSP0439-20130205/52543_1 /TAXON_ID=0 /ORGANISM="Stereomyxa ramosa, Strain Chinc5" /LENGTH=651 /DNA_ID=CAMNT_0015363639 /DNA_START=528 /DNA_END=2483 /DNA_ORIENTATION=+
MSVHFFKEHKEEEWFREKYDPEYLEKKRLKMMEAAKANEISFAEDHEAGKNDYNIEVDVDVGGTHVLKESSDLNEDDKGKEKDSESDKKESPEEKESVEEKASGDEKVDVKENGTDSAVKDKEGEEENGDKKEKSDSESDREGSSDKSGSEKTKEETEEGKRIISLKPSKKRKNAMLDVPLECITSLSTPDTPKSSPYMVEPPRDPNCIFIKSIPRLCSRAELKEVFNKVEGFVKLILSEPDPRNDFIRVGWVIYDNQGSCKMTLHKYNGYRMNSFDLNLTMNKPAGGNSENKRIKVAPPEADSDERVAKDAEQSSKLLRLLDSEREIETHPFVDFISAEDERMRLNINIVYLRKVHLFCYYCGTQFEDEEELQRCCGVRHLRSKNKNRAGPNPQTAWLSSLDERIEARLDTTGVRSPDMFTGKAVLKERMDQFYEENIKEMDKAKFRCLRPDCNKLFCAIEFVKKHIRLKHNDVVDEIKKKAMEYQYYENYKNDPGRVKPQLPSTETAYLPPPPVPTGYHPMPHRGMSRRSFYGMKDPYMSRPAPPPPRGYGVWGGRGASPYDNFGWPARGVGRSPRGRRRQSFPPFGHSSLPLPPPGDFMEDPRSIKQYVDLDAPPGDDVVVDYRTSIDYGDLDSSDDGSDQEKKEEED